MASRLTRDIDLLPEREAFLFNERENNSSRCEHCEKIQQEIGEHSLVLYHSAHCSIRLSSLPYNTGHLQIFPNRHVISITELMDNENLDIMHATQLCISVLEDIYSPHGFSIGSRTGTTRLNQRPQHLCFHVIPRWQGDVNLIETIDTRRELDVIIKQAYRRLASAFENSVSRPVY